jgi:transposase
VPATLAAAATPLLEQIEALNRNIAAMDRLIEQLAARYPEIERLRSVPGVGPGSRSNLCAHPGQQG